MTDNEGHYIDDPLTVMNTKPDFSGMGIEPEHTNATKMSLQNICGDITIPDWITFTPKDWEGETIMELLKIDVSKHAEENEELNLKEFLARKLLKLLNAVRQKHGMSELQLTDRFQAIIYTLSNKAKVSFYFHVEFAKQK